MIRIVIAEDHALFRSGLKQILSLQKNLNVEGEASNCKEAFALCAELNPDLLLLDISMPEINGIEAIPRFREICPQMKILIISMHGMAEYVRSAFKAGANGYLLKTADSDEFFLAIQTVLNDKQYVSRELTGSVLTMFLHNEKEENLLESLLHIPVILPLKMSLILKMQTDCWMKQATTGTATANVFPLLWIIWRMPI